MEHREIEPVKITERISYIPASKEPLSADVIFIEGEEYLYVFDVGNNVQVAEYINGIPKKKKVILSHFHADHIGNLGRVACETVFCGTETKKHMEKISPYTMETYGDTVCVAEPVFLTDGISIAIYPVPSSHAKESLLLLAEDYIFLGDSLYCQTKGNLAVYNAQLLQEEIRLLKDLPATYVFSSHEKRPVKPKTVAVRFLEQIYAKREKNNPYIAV